MREWQIYLTWFDLIRSQTDSDRVIKSSIFVCVTEQRVYGLWFMVSDSKNEAKREWCDIFLAIVTMANKIET